MGRRTTKINITEDWKKKIQVTSIMNRLNDHVDGKIDLSSTQLKAADIILRKMVPDLGRTEVAIDPNANSLLVEIVKFSETEKPD